MELHYSSSRGWKAHQKSPRQSVEQALFLAPAGRLDSHTKRLIPFFGIKQDRLYHHKREGLQELQRVQVMWAQEIHWLSGITDSKLSAQSYTSFTFLGDNKTIWEQRNFLRCFRGSTRLGKSRCVEGMGKNFSVSKSGFDRWEARSLFIADLWRTCHSGLFVIIKTLKGLPSL